jgi:hypothetical protein
MTFNKGESPGRTNGSKNRFSKVKSDLLDAFNAAGGKNRIIMLIKQNPELFMQYVKVIASLLPKEQHNKNQHDINIKYLTNTPRPQGIGYIPEKTSHTQTELTEVEYDTNDEDQDDNR